MKRLGFRYYQLIIVGIVLMAILAVRLFVLTVIQHDTWSASALSLSQKEIYTSAPRGRVLDRYGRVLADNVHTFSVNFDVTGMENEEINRVALETIEILESNGDDFTDEFPIVFEDGRFQYTYQQEIEEWLISEGMPTYYTAEQAFNQIRENLEIDESYDVYEAQAEMQNIYNVYPPISVKTMTFTKDQDKQIFLGIHSLDKKNLEYDISAEDAFNKLREKYEIDDSYSIEEARKILIVRQEITELGYSKYMSARLATDISDASIIMLKEKSSSLKGITVDSESKRYYPYGNTASHILGYIGKISESARAEYVTEKGYNPNDLIGQSGIESSFESVLRGTDGVKTVQVDAKGNLTKVISETEAIKGDDVYLTIDMDMQIVAEEALEEALTEIRRAGLFEGKYGNYKYGTAYDNANVGAVVAIEIETGEILAMASYPDYDPNLFATGISGENWLALQSQNPRDYLAPAPLYNVAARTAVQPGSTFKMAVGLAAMRQGWSPDQKLKDDGFVMLGNRPFNCLIWTTNHSTHGYVDLAHALEVSCNYYFYDIGSGIDHYTGKDLGYTIEMSDIMETAMQFGLGVPTGIEITETVAPVPSEDQKLTAMKSSLRHHLNSNAEDFFESSVVRDEELLAEYIEEIVSWTEENPSRGTIIERLPDYGVKEERIEKVADDCKYSFFNQAKITLADDFNISIGQGENMYTPVQMANYVATIGNGGYLNEVTLIKQIQNHELEPKKEPVKADVSDEQLDAVIEGMKLVTGGTNGNMRGVFGSFPVKVAAKSGTAEKSGVIQPADEVEYIKKYLRYLDYRLSWADVEAEMNRLLTEEGSVYKTEAAAVDQAVKNLSGGRVTQSMINQWKDVYDPFAWVVAMAPADDPEIAVAVLLVQGGTGGYAAPVAREVIGEYFKLNADYNTTTLETVIQ